MCRFKSAEAARRWKAATLHRKRPTGSQVEGAARSVALTGRNPADQEGTPGSHAEATGCWFFHED